jgi:hypothetical protein
VGLTEMSGTKATSFDGGRLVDHDDALQCLLTSCQREAQRTPFIKHTPKSSYLYTALIGIERRIDIQNCTSEIFFPYVRSKELIVKKDNITSIFQNNSHSSYQSGQTLVRIHNLFL